LLDQLQQQAAETLRLNATLKHAEAKIQALTFELAHLRRIRFGAKSEALNAEQRDLFQETLAADIAACEAEAEQAVPQSPRQTRTCRPPAAARSPAAHRTSA
jgi:transposase